MQSLTWLQIIITAFMLMMGITHAMPSTRACVHGGSGHVKAGPASAPGAAITPVKHLIVEANGLFGYSGNWDVINQYLTTHLDMDHYLIHASKANQKTQVRSTPAIHCTAIKGYTW